MNGLVHRQTLKCAQVEKCEKPFVAFHLLFILLVKHLLDFCSIIWSFKLLNPFYNNTHSLVERLLDFFCYERGKRIFFECENNFLSLFLWDLRYFFYVLKVIKISFFLSYLKFNLKKKPWGSSRNYFNSEFNLMIKNISNDFLKAKNWIFFL